MFITKEAAPLAQHLTGVQVRGKWQCIGCGRGLNFIFQLGWVITKSRSKESGTKGTNRHDPAKLSCEAENGEDICKGSGASGHREEGKFGRGPTVYGIGTDLNSSAYREDRGGARHLVKMERRRGKHVTVYL